MVLTAEGAALLLIDLQERLMPVIAEWLRDARHPRFREVHKLLR